MKEQELLLLLKKGDKDAFTALYNKYWNQVYNFCRLYLISKEDAEEVVQEVFTKLWTSRDMIIEDANFKGLLFIITRNLIFNQHRKRVNENYYKVSVLSALENSSYNLENEIEAKDLSQYIDILIEEMPSKRRLIFNLSRKEHKSYKEIAEMLGISEKTVERHIYDSIKYLKKNILLLSIFLAIHS